MLILLFQLTPNYRAGRRRKDKRRRTRPKQLSRLLGLGTSRGPMTYQQIVVS